MPVWYGFGLEHEVIQVLRDGLLVSEVHGNGNLDDPFFVTNYPGFKSLVDNQKIEFLALRTGSYRYTDTLGAIKTVPFYDYGIPVSITELNAALHPSPSPEQRAASAQAQAEKNRALLAPALKYYQGLADQGDAFGQFRMGEFYRDGDAVPKDLSKAKEYFTKAAAQGNQAAAVALERLNAAGP